MKGQGNANFMGNDAAVPRKTFALGRSRASLAELEVPKLARTCYDPSQIATCRAAFAEMLETWRKVAARCQARARAEAESAVFNQRVVAWMAGSATASAHWKARMATP